MEELQEDARTEAIAELKTAALGIHRLAAEMSLLEKELDLKKREMHQLTELIIQKQEQASITAAEKKALGSWLSSEHMREHIPNAVVTRWMEVDKKLEEVGIEDAMCSFDRPNILQITVPGGGRDPHVIDVVESVKASPSNIGHPLIVECIRRYCLILSQPTRNARNKDKTKFKTLLEPDVAKDCLDRIFRALIVGSESKSTSLERHAFDMVALAGEHHREYFASLWSILREEDIKCALRAGTKLERIRQKLVRLYPDRSHDDVLEYLGHAFRGDDKASLPTRGGGEALKNAFLAWKFNISPQSARVYLSNSQRQLRDMVSGVSADFDSSNLFSEKEISKYVDDFMFASFGVKSMRPYEDLSKLVKVKTGKEQPS